MLEERHKAEIISHELLRYFLDQRMAKIGMTIEFESIGFTVEVAGELEKEPESLGDFTRMLNVDRDEDLEDYLEGLWGTNHEAQDYALLGIMTDDATVNLTDNCLTVRLFRARTTV